VTRSGSNRPPSRPPVSSSVGVEAEFGFRLGRDLPARSAPYRGRRWAPRSTPSCRSSRSATRAFPSGGSRRIEEITADNAFNGGVVVGTAFEAWRSLDLATHHVTLSVDGERKGEGTGALVLGHPLIALTWLANEMSRRGDGLRAGELVAAGTCTGLHFAQAGAQLSWADFGAASAPWTIKFTD
jgi:2-keto-4-pentenoate hydratase